MTIERKLKFFVPLTAFNSSFLYLGEIYLFSFSIWKHIPPSNSWTCPRIYALNTCKIESIFQLWCYPNIDAYVIRLTILYHLNFVQNARPPLPPTCPKAFNYLISRCWSSSPDRRPHFDQIVSILEGYSESLEQDPEFFSSFIPSPDHTILRCLPTCIARHCCAHSKAKELFLKEVWC